MYKRKHPFDVLDEAVYLLLMLKVIRSHQYIMIMTKCGQNDRYADLDWEMVQDEI